MAAGTRHHVWGAVLGVLLLTLGVAACTTVSDTTFKEIGTTRVLAIDSDLSPQSISDPETPIQVAEWTLTLANLDSEFWAGNSKFPLDLTVGGDCNIVGTAFALPVADGRCAAGMIIDSSPDEAIPITLDVTFKLRVRRARPVDLPLGSDYDGDGVLNETDICPLVPNPGQEDENGGDGIGDACSTGNPLGAGNLLDSDGDGVADIFDNCVWVPNPGQDDRKIQIGGTTVPRGIGDACEEQVAKVMWDGDESIPANLGPIDLLQPQAGLTFLTVDLSDQSSLDTMSCTWGTVEVPGSCNLSVDPSSLRFCRFLSVSETILGCPD